MARLFILSNISHVPSLSKSGSYSTEITLDQAREICNSFDFDDIIAVCTGNGCTLDLLSLQLGIQPRTVEQIPNLKSLDQIIVTTSSDFKNLLHTEIQSYSPKSED